MKKSIFLCAISNISSGSCAEDCGFCTQSARHHADIERYKYKPVDQIVFEAKNASNNGAIGFCLVTSGLGLDDKKLSFVCEAARAIKAELPDLNLIACNGIASVEQLKTLNRRYAKIVLTVSSFYNSLMERMLPADDNKIGYDGLPQRRSSLFETKA